MQDHGHGVAFSYVKKSTTKQYELNSSLIKTMVTTTQMDSYENTTNVLVDNGQGYTTRTVSTFTNNTSNWHLGRLM